MAKQLAMASLIALLVSALFTSSYLLPFNPVLLSFGPLTLLFPQLDKTGSAVEYGFAWLIIKERWVWCAIFVYYFVIAFVVTELAILIRKLDRQQAEELENNPPSAH